ncbi:pathogenesis-related family 1 protein [Spirulina subsalsa FACHB-351]|uniref:Pathogenesis-related family 1 protein n=2 Tax=Spirulina subsalsa TaxID=54311 RepID=A0ABT3L5B6_9CYAN|nr:pathogenesis-related family 1 protein [Spirulina subsalsa FACHB-351]
MTTAQSPSFPLDGTPVYVEKNGQWREARLTQWYWHSQTGEQYNVFYLDDQSTETGVPPSRIRSLEQAQNSGITTNVYDLDSRAGIEQMLNAHNQWRSQVGVPPLRWSAQLSRYAQEWADHLLATNQFEHRSDSLYGENLAMSSGQQMSPQRVVDLWGEEIKDYNYQQNSCTPGEMCGHYTQIVWKTTTEVGCAVARQGRREVWVCNYNPPGNYVGQRPY